jgi:uncharacterized membrane protein YedE/YeeE
MENFTPISGLVGGLMIGLASAALLYLHGRIAGISGIVGGVLQGPGTDTAKQEEFWWRLAFVIGLIVGPMIVAGVAGVPNPVELQTGWIGLIAAGLLVGIGTRIGAGCTSGHGVCGMARLSARSIVATVTFMLVAGVTVFVIRHVVGG